jgi:hypothetical protein
MKKQICQINTNREEQLFLVKTFSRILEIAEVEKTADESCVVFFLIYDRENKNASA